MPIYATQIQHGIKTNLWLDNVSYSQVCSTGDARCKIFNVDMILVDRPPQSTQLKWTYLTALINKWTIRKIKNKYLCISVCKLDHQQATETPYSLFRQSAIGERFRDWKTSENELEFGRFVVLVQFIHLLFQFFVSSV